MHDLTKSPMAVTSCPLLDKLAPETRVKICGYALTFDNPIKHSKNMQPFLEKITGKQNIENTAESGVATTDSLHRINTSILSTNKLIYKESIPVFYKNNVIHFNAQEDLEEKDIVHPHATDLSLATQVITKADAGMILAPDQVVGVDTLHLVVHVFPLIFPKLRTRTAYLYTDSTPSPAASLFSTANLLRSSSMLETVSFEGVGALVAIPASHPGMKIFVQSKLMIERWSSQNPPGQHTAEHLGAKLLYEHSRVGSEDRNDAVAVATILFASFRAEVVPPQYPPIPFDSHEFWTVVDWASHEDTLE